MPDELFGSSDNQTSFTEHVVKKPVKAQQTGQEERKTVSKHPSVLISRLYISLLRRYKFNRPWRRWWLTVSSRQAKATYKWQAQIQPQRHWQLVNESETTSLCHIYAVNPTANLSLSMSCCFDPEPSYLYIGSFYILDMMMFNDLPLARTWKLRVIHPVSPEATEWKMVLRVSERFLLREAWCSLWSPLCWKHSFSD